MPPTIDQILNLAPQRQFFQWCLARRFFQIRGIGEAQSFVEPVNPSVGLLVDGIDLTGIGGAATTLDITQAEILRGPQGTLFGANALAGMINLVLCRSGRFSGKGISVCARPKRGGQAFEGAIGGPISGNAGLSSGLCQRAK